MAAEPDQKRATLSPETLSTEPAGTEPAGTEPAGTEALDAGAPDHAAAAEGDTDTDDNAGSEDTTGVDDGVPLNVMVLPEPVRPHDRPTVAITRGPCQGSPNGRKRPCPAEAKST